mgnify:CR=1 FL=1
MKAGFDDRASSTYISPSLLPQAGLGPAIEVNAKQDLAIASVPEVESVVGKIGRSESALDPAPIGMIESIVILKPEDEWRRVPRWYSGRVPDWLTPLVRPLWPDRISWDELVAQMDEALERCAPKNNPFGATR